MVQCLNDSRYLPSPVEHAEELGNQLLVPESAARLGAHSEGSLLVAERRLVGTRRAQRIIDIHDLQNARQQRNVAVTEPIGITTAVRMLVMMAKNRKPQPQRF